MKNADEELQKNTERPLYYGHFQRLRERLLRTGSAGFAPLEILEYFLHFSQPRRDTKPLARRLLVEFGSLNNVFAATPAELEKIPGMGPSTIASFVFWREMAGALAEERLQASDSIASTEQAVNYFRCKLAFGPTEALMVLLLNRRHRLLASLTFRGSVENTIIAPGEIARAALEHHASLVILGHNHPSGFTDPSPEDIRLTRQVRDGLSLLGIELVDHLIITRRDSRSIIDL